MLIDPSRNFRVYLEIQKGKKKPSVEGLDRKEVERD
jgi:hypothetical protein